WPQGLLRGVPRWVGARERRQMHMITNDLRDKPRKPAEQPHRTSDDRVEHRLDIGRRSGDDLQDLTCRRLLVSGFGEFALQVRIGYRWRSSLRGLLSRCPTPRTKLSVCYRIVLLAPKTLHAEALPAAGSAKGRNRGPRLPARDSRGQGHRHT